MLLSSDQNRRMNLLIIGASRGLGAALALNLPRAGDHLWTVSRTRPEWLEGEGVTHHWIEADVSSSGWTAALTTALGDAVLDAVIYNAGIWEANAFSPDYDFSQISDFETERIIAVNLTGAIACARAVLPNLCRSSKGKLVFIGSTSGLENSGRPEVAYVASNFGRRGVAHALREVLRPDRIAVTCLNLGDIGTIEVKGAEVSARGFDSRPLLNPKSVLEVMRLVLSLDFSSCIKEIDLPAMTDSL